VDGGVFLNYKNFRYALLNINFDFALAVSQVSE
jgi:hypothetical protein